MARGGRVLTRATFPAYHQHGPAQRGVCSGAVSPEGNVARPPLPCEGSKGPCRGHGT